MVAAAPCVARAAYTVAKHMITHQSKQTYVLKNCLFYCLEASKDNTNCNRSDELDSDRAEKINSSVEEINKKELNFWIEKLFKCFLLFTLQDCVPCYLMPEFVLPFCDEFQYDRDPLHCRYFDEVLSACVLYMNTCRGSDSDISVRVLPQALLNREELIRMLSETQTQLALALLEDFKPSHNPN